MKNKMSTSQKQMLYSHAEINAKKPQKIPKKIDSPVLKARRAIEKMNDDLAIEHINTAHLEEDF